MFCNELKTNDHGDGNRGPVGRRHDNDCVRARGASSGARANECRRFWTELIDERSGECPGPRRNFGRQRADTGPGLQSQPSPVPGLEPRRVPGHEPQRDDEPALLRSRLVNGRDRSRLAANARFSDRNRVASARFGDRDHFPATATDAGWNGWNGGWGGWGWGPSVSVGFGGGWGWPGYDYGYANPGLYAYSPGFVGAGFGGGCSCNRGWWQ